LSERWTSFFEQHQEGKQTALKLWEIKGNVSGKFSQLINHRLFLMTVIFIGLLLRLYQLGTDSFWIDEVSVVQVIQKSSLVEMLQAAHNHVMAMPLDYVLDWVLARFVSSEGFLRLPAVFWGVLTLGVCYLFFKHFTNQATAVLTTLFLALSPFHIQYSQELRFYAALVFFYWLVTWQLWRAIDNPTIKRWVLFSLSAIIGIYFHVYVLLAAINGIFWLWVTPSTNPTRLKARTYFLRAMSSILLAFIIGLLIFGSVNMHENTPLLMNDSSVFGLLGIAFGWLPFYTPSSFTPYILGMLSLLLAMTGSIHLVRQQPRGPASVLIYSIAVQIFVIIGMNSLKKYFLAPRQFIAYLPLMLFLSAYGAIALANQVGSWLDRRGKSQENSPVNAQWLTLGLLIVFIITNVPALVNYYQGDKGKAREISRLLEHVWLPGDTILTIPDYEANTFSYYIEKEFGAGPLLSSIYSASWDAISKISSLPGDKYLITPYPLNSTNALTLATNDFEPFYIPKLVSSYSQAVWVLHKSNGQLLAP
jgi:hypothetical protein